MHKWPAYMCLSCLHMESFSLLRSCSCFIAQMSFHALGNCLQLASRVAACRVWVALRMKDNVVSGILKSRVQDKHTDSISDKAFEQVSIVMQQYLRVSFAGNSGSQSPTSACIKQPPSSVQKGNGTMRMPEGDMFDRWSFP